MNSMIQTANSEIWLECWNSSPDESDLITDEIQADRWNKRAAHFSKDEDEDRKKKKTEEFLEFLHQAEFSPKGASVLDIGCGPGSLAIPLARAGATVTALDISHQMLQRLKEQANQENLAIHPIECSWWSADIDSLGYRNKFDLVIASMTPGIKDADTFSRMMACSKKYCYYSNFIQKDPEKIPYELLVKELGEIPEQVSLSSGLLFPFMYLYTLGIHPHIKIYRKSIPCEMSWSDAADKAIDYLEIRRNVTNDEKEKIMRYYQNSSLNGMVHSKSQIYSGMMVWSMGNTSRQ